MPSDTDAVLDEVAQREYKYGFVTDIEADKVHVLAEGRIVRSGDKTLELALELALALELEEKGHALVEGKREAMPSPV